MARTRRIRHVVLSLAMATGAMLLFSGIAQAYPPVGSTLSETSGCATTKSGGTCTFSFQLKDANGNVLANQTVNFSVSGVAGASVSPTTATTNANGVASTTFSAGTTACGVATVTASSPPTATGQATTSIPCNAQGLPFTAPSAPGTPPWLIAIMVLALLTVAAGGLALRRMRVTA